MGDPIPARRRPACLLALLLSTGCAPSPERVPHLPEAVPGHFWVRLAPGGDAALLDAWEAQPALPETAHAQTAAVLGLDRTFLVHTDRTRAERLARHPDVAWVHPESVAHAAAVPDDPLYPNQWHFDIVGAPEAWGMATGAGTKVAVIDTGVEPAADGLGNLLVDECWDFIDFDDDCADPRSHGTHVAGTINQATDNGLGGSGLAPASAIVPVRVIDADDYGPELAIAQGVIWAADRGSDVMNLSLGGGGAMPLVEDAFAYAHAAGTVIVAATGNQSWDHRVLFPAAYEQAIAVAATNLFDERTGYSNAGPETDLSAPGGDTGADLDGDGWVDGVIQETVEDGFQAWQGTSMATPHVAAAAALVMSRGLTHPDDVRLALESTAVDLGEPGFDWEYGHGRIDIPAALRWTRRSAVPLAITRTDSREVAPGAVRVLWQSTKPTRGWLEDADGLVLGHSAGFAARHAVEVLGEPGDALTVYAVAVEPGGELVLEPVDVVL